MTASFHRQVTTPFRNLFFVCLGVVLFLLEPIALPLQSEAHEADSLPNILGRTVRLDALCDDFEDKDWNYDYQNHICYRGFWRPAHRGEPELLTRVATPDGGKTGSTGALEMRTNDNDNDGHPDQEDLLTAEFNQKLERELTRADQPVFIVRVWLPPFDQWTEGRHGNFGFRQTARSSNGIEYYPSIWLVYDRQVQPEPFFVFRIGTGEAYDVRGESITKPGWWTLAIAFDERGIGHYYAVPGAGIPTEGNRMFDTTQFRTKNGTENPYMDHMGYSFFSLGYPSDENISPRFVIDDYEVWVVKDTNGRS